MLKTWYARLLLLLAVVCMLTAVQPAVQAQDLQEDTAQTEASALTEEPEQPDTQTAAPQSGIYKSGYCGANGENLRWTLTYDGTLTISGSGAMKDYTNQSPAPWGYTAVTLIVENRVTHIGSNAFIRYTGLTSVKFPDSLTSIGDYAFYGCTGLTSVKFPDSLTSIGNYAFQGCTGLTSVSFPDSLTSIGYSAFLGCTELTSVDFPDTLTSTGGAAFFGCTGLTRVSFPDGLTSIGNSAFYGCTGLTSVSFPDGLTSIGDYAFYGCTGLTGDLILPNGLTAVADRAFYDCSFKTITVPAGVCSIGPYGLDCNSAPDICFLGAAPSVTAAKENYPSFSRSSRLFYNPEQPGWTGDGYDGSTGKWNGYTLIGDRVADGVCGENLTWKLGWDGTLTISGSGKMEDYFSRSSQAPWYCHRNLIRTLTLSPGVASIGSYAFFGYTELTSVSFPDGLTSIYYNAFHDCTGLTSVDFPKGLTIIYGSAFNGCTGLTSVNFPDSLTSIGNYAFSGCTGLTSVKFPNSLTSIGMDAFSGCTGLTSVIFPNSLTSIGMDAFSGCTGLTNVIFPNSLTSIDIFAFSGCTGLTGEVKLPSGLTSISSSAFSGCTGITGFAYEGTGTYRVVDGVLFNNAQLIAYPCGNPRTAYTVPDGITEICSNAFRGCAALTKIVFPDSLTSIGSAAFSGCTGLTDVYFLGSAPSRSNGSFPESAGCPINIYYDASTTGWDTGSWPQLYYTLIQWTPYAATGVQLETDALTLKLGSSQQLRATVTAYKTPKDPSVVWSSSNLDVAAVFADGTVLGKQAGTAVITATTVDGGFTASCTVTVEPAPAGAMQVRLDSVCARPGNTVQVRLMLDRNPGFANLSLALRYDTSIMTLTKVENAVTGAQFTHSQTLTKNPYMLTWNTGSSCTASGTLATLTFQINGDAPYGVYPIMLSYYPGINDNYIDGSDVNYDSSRKALPLVYIGSSADIRSYIPGDINGDGCVDSRDVLSLLRYLSGWDNITVIEEALDVNGDSRYNYQDATDLLRYVAGWDVVLH